MAGGITQGQLDPNLETGSGGSTITKNQVAHGFSLLDGIYHNGTIWVKAQADDADTVATYCVFEIADIDNFRASKFGPVEVLGHGKTIGEYYFQSTTTPGAPSISAPTSGFSNPLFYVEDANTIHMTVHRAVFVSNALAATVEGYNSSDWTSYIPTTFNIATSQLSGFYRRVGDSAEIMIVLTLSATPTSTIKFAPPAGLGINTSIVNSGDIGSLGSATFLKSGSNVYYSGTVKSEGVNVGIVGDNSTATAWNWDQFKPVPSGSGDRISLRYTIPIQGWTSQSTRVVTQKEIVNPNILINGDCRVNQRESFPVTGIVNLKYYTDRWSAYLAGAGTVANASLEIGSQPSVLLGSKSVKYTCTTAPTTTGSIGTQQLVEDYSLYSEKIVTASAWVKSNSINARLLVVGGATTSTAHSGSGLWELLTSVHTVGSSPTNLRSLIRISTPSGGFVAISDADENNSGEAAYIEFTGAKLELGSNATNFIANSYANELRDCQRYYWQGKIRGDLGQWYTDASYTSMFAGSTSFPVSMRIYPAITVLTPPIFTNCSTLSYQASDEGISIRVTTDGAGIYRAVDGIYSAYAEL